MDTYSYRRKIFDWLLICNKHHTSIIYPFCFNPINHMTSRLGVVLFNLQPLPSYNVGNT